MTPKIGDKESIPTQLAASHQVVAPDRLEAAYRKAVKLSAEREEVTGIDKDSSTRAMFGGPATSSFDCMFVKEGDIGITA